RHTRSKRDWSSDVCSSDLVEELPVLAHELPSLEVEQRIAVVERVVAFLATTLLPHTQAEQLILYPEADRLLGGRHDGGAVAHNQIGRASCREKVESTGVAV